MLDALVDDVADVQPSDLVRLLPAFDQYVVTAPRDQEAVLAPAYKKRVYRPQGWLSPVVVVDGRIAGTWSHEQERDRVEVRLEPFAKATKRLREGVRRRRSAWRDSSAHRSH